MQWRRQQGFGSQQLGSGWQHDGSGMQQLGSGWQHDGAASQQLGWQQPRRWNNPAFASWLPARNKAATAIRGNRIFAFIGGNLLH